MVFRGIVQEGNRTGRRLGFPTANIPLTDTRESGIFAARVFIGGKQYSGVAYINHKNRVLEAHVFDFSEEVYGAEIEVVLLQKVREDRAFVDEEEAKTVIASDVTVARAYFNIV